MSKVIHVRVDAVTIAQCYQILALGGQDTFRVPMATAISKALSAFISGAVLGGQLKSISTVDAEQIIYNAVGTTTTEVEPVVGVAPVFEEEKKEDLPTLEEAIDRTVDRVLSGGAVADAPENLPDADELPTSKKDFSDIKAEAPLDALVQQCELMEDPARRDTERAIAIVYSSLSEDMWGTAKAAELVEDTLAIIGRSEDEN